MIRGLRHPRLVVVTGAGSGIGRGAALEFAAGGATLLATDINEITAKETAQLVRERGGRAHAYRLDVADRAAWEDFADTVRDEHAPVADQPTPLLTGEPQTDGTDGIRLTGRPERSGATAVGPTAASSPVPLLTVEMPGRASVGVRVAAASIRRARPVISGVLSRTNRVPIASVPGIETAERAAAVLRPPRGTRVRSVRLERCPAEWVIAPGIRRGRRVVLYFHGGLFVAAGLRTHRRLVAKISRAAGGVPVLNVAYRLLPKVTLAELIEDGLAAYQWLLDRGTPAEQIVVAGDSAGGFLAFAVPIAARDAGLPVPAGIVALSPMTDLDPSAKERHPNAALDPFMVPELFRVLDTYVASGLIDPSLSPVRADLEGLPPALIQVGSIEILRADAELIAERLAAAGVACRLQLWQGQVHDFQIAADVLPDGRAAIADIARFIDYVTSG